MLKGRSFSASAFRWRLSRPPVAREPVRAEAPVLFPCFPKTCNRAHSSALARYLLINTNDCLLASFKSSRVLSSVKNSVRLEESDRVSVELGGLCDALKELVINCHRTRVICSLLHQGRETGATTCLPSQHNSARIY